MRGKGGCGVVGGGGGGVCVQICDSVLPHDSEEPSTWCSFQLCSDDVWRIIVLDLLNLSTAPKQALVLNERIKRFECCEVVCVSVCVCACVRVCVCYVCGYPCVCV